MNCLAYINHLSFICVSRLCHLYADTPLTV